MCFCCESWLLAKWTSPARMITSNANTCNVHSQSQIWLMIDIDEIVKYTNLKNVSLQCLNESPINVWIEIKIIPSRFNYTFLVQISPISKRCQTCRRSDRPFKVWNRDREKTGRQRVKELVGLRDPPNPICPLKA